MTEGCLQIVAVLVSGYTLAEDWLFYSPRTHMDSGGYEPVLVSVLFCYCGKILRPKQLRGRKDFFHVTLSGYSPSLWEARPGTQGRTAS